MKPSFRAIACAGAIAVLGCGRIEKPPRGGAPEQALVAATAAKDLPRVRQLLAAGANPNAMITFEGASHSAWEYALTQVRSKQPETIELVKVLLKGGANPNSAWGGGIVRGIAREGEQLPILLAMLHPEPDVVRALVDAGMNPKYGQTALVMAVEEEDVEIVRILVDHGVDVNCHPGANTPLLAAIDARNVPLMVFLEEHGAREKP
jgi:ankyrin repeat protein